MRRLFCFALIILCIIRFPANAEEEEEPGRAYFDFGVFAFEDGDYEGAEGNFKKAIIADPENPYYNHYMGKTYIKMKRFEEALRTKLRGPEISTSSARGGLV